MLGPLRTFNACMREQGFHHGGSRQISTPPSCEAASMHSTHQRADYTPVCVSVNQVSVASCPTLFGSPGMDWEVVDNVVDRQLAVACRAREYKIVIPVCKSLSQLVETRKLTFHRARGLVRQSSHPSGAWPKAFDASSILEDACCLPFEAICEHHFGSPLGLTLCMAASKTNPRHLALQASSPFEDGRSCLLKFY